MNSNAPTGSSEPLIRNISDTARWVAAYRAMETERPDALFHDPYARRLAGEKGADIAEAMPFQGKTMWPFTMRTYLIDEFIRGQIQKGTDMVVNLAAGLDARPYRMDLPSLAAMGGGRSAGNFGVQGANSGKRKAEMRARARAAGFVRSDARKALFQQLGSRSKSALILSEGLLVYLTPENVASLASDLAAPPSFRNWILDLASPGLVKMLAKQKMGQELSKTGIPFKFAPPEGPEYFEKFGWKPVDVRSVFKAAAAHKRLPFFMSLFAFFPDTKESRIKRPWTGICLFEKQSI